MKWASNVLTMQAARAWAGEVRYLVARYSWTDCRMPCGKGGLGPCIRILVDDAVIRRSGHAEDRHLEGKQGVVAHQGGELEELV